MVPGTSFLNGIDLIKGFQKQSFVPMAEKTVSDFEFIYLFC